MTDLSLVVRVMPGLEAMEREEEKRRCFSRANQAFTYLRNILSGRPFSESVHSLLILPLLQRQFHPMRHWCSCSINENVFIPESYKIARTESSIGHSELLCISCWLAEPLPGIYRPPLLGFVAWMRRLRCLP